MKLKSGFKIVFTGDSITDAGRMGQFYPLGNGYVKFFAELLASAYPELSVQIFNTGISGNTVKDLKDRWDDDVLSLSPDWLIILIGINDLNRYLDGVTELSPESYERTYDELLFAAEKEVRGITLITPFYISRGSYPGTRRDAVLKLLPSYTDAVRRLRVKHSTELIDLQADFENLVKKREPTAFALEPIHPNEAGHLFMAMKLLSYVEPA
ncbi:MAG: SGNH/GDSL hydrolase family protein [TACK group archaeon]|nr:SGNH/GDSL hydrolase family protein [TACK group archaeon]